MEHFGPYGFDLILRSIKVYFCNHKKVVSKVSLPNMTLSILLQDNTVESIFIITVLGSMPANS